MACERSGENPNDGKNLRAKLGTTLSLVRFTVLSIKEFAEFVGWFYPLMSVFYKVKVHFRRFRYFNLGRTTRCNVYDWWSKSNRPTDIGHNKATIK